MAQILTIKSGRAQQLTFSDGQTLETAIRKTPVARVEIDETGIIGNEVSLKAHHGGVDKALFFMAEQSIAALNALSGQAVDYRETAVYGENFVVSEWDESHICVGDRYRIGSCLVEISQPRRPCSRLSKNSGWSEMQKTVFQHGLTGWYARVVEGGEIRSGDTLKLQSRPYPQWTIKRLNALLSGERDAAAIEAALACEPLAAAFKRALEGKLQGNSGMVAG